jgi:hypothetical protein
VQRPRAPVAPGDGSCKMAVLRSARGGKVALEHPRRTKKLAGAMLEAKEARGELATCDQAAQRRFAVVAPSRGDSGLEEGCRATRVHGDSDGEVGGPLRVW